MTLNVAAETAETKTTKWRMSQEHIDFIMSWDISDFVFRGPDNIDNMPISDKLKQKYGDNRKEAISVMGEHRRVNKEIQEWVKSELDKHGCVDAEITDEMFAKYRDELVEQGYVEVETPAA